MSTPPLILSVIHFTTCSVSIIFGSILLLIAALKTPIYLAPYSVLLRTLTVIELTTSISAFLVFPRIVPLGIEGVACVYSGPVKWLFSNKFFFYVIELHGTVQYNVFMAVCFCFRYYVLKWESPNTNQIRVFMAIVLSFTTFLFILFVQCLAPHDITLAYIEKYVPHYDIDPNSVQAIVNLSHSLATPAIGWTILTAGTLSSLNIVVGRAIFRFLNDKNHHLSERTRSTHRQFVVALSLQAIIGQLILFAAVGYVLGQFDLVRSQILEYSVHMVSEFCVATSPLITLFYIKPYRSVFFSLFPLRNGKVRKLMGSSMIPHISVTPAQ
ncbi:hypothetical protein PRIPAC_80188 [Pristionchus pacificus]|uniref:G protein-coupled receptor n=1 Tax=Pristionchus pacificus TaxID=54126 RepID=A0A2A6C3Y3_PRIPA|nr:hypothetical protein PRIPAC_80188 [Pristionchus pacificus]|eukprot:PDM72817.1 G protein-coupled receptor [Pristionchus pacificus]